MFSKASCVGRLCPSSLEEINVSGFVNRVIFVPYVETDKGYFVQTFGKGELLKSECGNKSPFICGEEALEKHKVESRNITYVFFVGHTKPDEMLIFIKLDKKIGNGFVKIIPKMDLEYSLQIRYVLGSAIERFMLKGKDIPLSHILPQLKGKDLINFCRARVGGFQKECKSYIASIINDEMGNDFLKEGDYEKINVYILLEILYDTKFNLDESVRTAGMMDDKNIVQFLINNEGFPGHGLRGAAEGNHKDLVKWIFENYSVDPDDGLIGAAERGHLDLFKWIMKEYDANVGITELVFAAKGGHKNIVKFIIKSGVEHRWEDPGLRGAAKGGHEDLVNWFILKGAKDFNKGLKAAAEGGDINIVKRMIGEGARQLHIGLYGAVKGGHKNIVEYFIKKMARNHEDDAIDWNELLKVASQKGHRNIVDLLIEKMARNHEDDAIDWNELLKVASQKGHRNIVDLLIEKGANDFEGGLTRAAVGCHKDLVIFFIEKGARDLRNAQGIAGRRCRLYDFFTRKITEQEAPQEIHEEPEEVQEEERILPRMGWLE